MTDTISCKSCSMTIESGDYCQYCTDEGGSLLAFTEAFERFIQFAMQRDPDLGRPDAAKQTLEFMATRPAWTDHPDLAKARASR